MVAPEMSERGKVPVPGEEPPGDPWAIVGYLVAGMAFWGFVGWLLDKWTHHSNVFFPIGLIFGLGAAIYLVIARFSKL